LRPNRIPCPVQHLADRRSNPRDFHKGEIHLLMKNRHMQLRSNRLRLGKQYDIDGKERWE